MKALRFLPAFLLGLVLLACGGGDNPFEEEPPPVNPRLRAFQPGDKIIYRAFVEDLLTGAPAEGDLTWQIFDRVVNPAGRECLAYQLSGFISAPGTPGGPFFFSRGLFFQDATGIYACGKYDPLEDDRTFIVDRPETPGGLKLWIPDPVATGFTADGTVLYRDGSYDNCILTIDRKETLVTALGLFETFRVNQSCSFSDSGPAAQTNWLVPQIFFVRTLAATPSANIALDIIDTGLK